MLEPWIIEQIRRREEEERRRNERPQLEIPSGDERSERWRKHHEDPDRRDKDGGESEGEGRGRQEDDQPERGVMIIDFGV